MTDEQTTGPAEGTPSMPDPVHPDMAAGAPQEAPQEQMAASRDQLAQAPLTDEGEAGPDPSNTPVENLVEPLEDGEGAELHQRLGLRGDSTIAEHTDEALVMREATPEEKAGYATGESAPGDGA